MHHNTSHFIQINSLYTVFHDTFKPEPTTHKMSACESGENRSATGRQSAKSGRSIRHAVQQQAVKKDQPKNVASSSRLEEQRRHQALRIAPWQ